ncbi:MAG: hypothetical protein IPL33_16725 [Sphingobacteriales bacterium]|nr:hypothetical protein [Sphingobacteriales bacterium]
MTIKVYNSQGIAGRDLVEATNTRTAGTTKSTTRAGEYANGLSLFSLGSMQTETRQ